MGDANSGFVVTKAMFDDLLPAVSANAAVIVPVGVAIMALMVGISLIPRILYKFL